MLPRGSEFFRQYWNTFDRFGIPLYTIEMLSRVLECFLEAWKAF
jgi:hypothetical protein